MRAVTLSEVLERWKLANTNSTDKCTDAFNAYGNRAAETVIVAIVFNPETITPVREHKTGGGSTPAVLYRHPALPARPLAASSRGKKLFAS